MTACRKLIRMNTTPHRPFAAFDIDGTIIRWQLYHAVVEQLGKRGILSSEQFQRIKNARMIWKQRSGETSFKDYERTLVTVHDEALQGIGFNDYTDAIDHVISEYKNQTYVYTRDLIRSLQKQGYLLFAISASQVQIVEKLARYYGFDDWAGTEYEHDGQRFTGKKDVLLRGRKPEVLKEMAAKHSAAWKGSIAVGDSDSDIGMLEAVEQPIAFNPNKPLFEHASRVGWNIVVERKNMYYEMEKGDGSGYILAQTNT